MKKIICTTIALFLIMATVLAGCASSDPSSEAPAVGDTPEPASAQAEDSLSEDPASEEAQEDKVFRAATPGAHYPWNYVEDGELQGIDIDILNEVGRRIGYEVEFEIIEFSGLFGLIDNGKVDTGACQVTVTPVREESYTFSDNYAFSFYKLAVREDDDSITSLADLVGKIFISQPARVEAEIMETYIADNGLEDEIELVISDADPFLEISLGRADATFYPELMFEEKNTEGDFNLKMVGDVVGEEAHAYPFRKDVDPEFLAAFNQALEEMRADGFMSALFVERFGVDISTSGLE